MLYAKNCQIFLRENLKVCMKETCCFHGLGDVVFLICQSYSNWYREWIYSQTKFQSFLSCNEIYKLIVQLIRKSKHHKVDKTLWGRERDRISFSSSLQRHFFLLLIQLHELSFKCHKIDKTLWEKWERSSFSSSIQVYFPSYRYSYTHSWLFTIRS